MCVQQLTTGLTLQREAEHLINGGQERGEEKGSHSRDQSGFSQGHTIAQRISTDEASTMYPALCKANRDPCPPGAGTPLGEMDKCYTVTQISACYY